MSLQKFIHELQQRDLLSERQLAKLRDAAAERRMSPKALAKFLVQKSHLTQKQATEVLNAVLLGGGDLDAVLPTATPTADFEPDPPELSLAPIDDDEEKTEEDAGSSSIFASFLTNPQTKSTTPTPEREPPPSPKSRPKPELVEDVDEITLTAVETAPDGSEPIDAAERRTLRNTTSLSRSKGKKDRKKAKPRPKSAKGKGKWDSPLMLIGGGGLALLLLIGALIYWLLIWESGDQKLTLARAARDSGAYAQAIEQYDDFIAGSPRHPEHGLAEIELALLRIRQATEAANFDQALNIAEDQLKEIEDKKEFDEAHGDLAALLPQIAKGLADQTEKAGAGSAEAKQAAELANKALELCSNVTYIPKRHRDEGKLTAVRETLQLVERRNQTKLALDDALKTMQAALDGGDTNKAYTTYAQLLRTRHELADEPTLAEMLKKTTTAEQAAIRLVNEEQPAETAERPTPWIAALAVANRRIKPDASRGAPASGAAAGVACIRVDGAVYALEVASGELLWRRQVGHARSIWPQPIGADVLIADTARNELLRIESQTGHLKWRQSIGESFAQPLIVGERGFVAADSGKLYFLDLNSGARLGFVQFAQPLRVTPTVDRTSERMYVTGDHSCVYSILLKDLSCLGVYYLGHAEGSITKPPAAVMDKVAVLENDGVETSRLRLLSIGDDGAVGGQAGERRLTGLSSAAPYVSGRRLVVFTDRGQIDVYDIGSGGSGEVLALVATRAAAGNKPDVRSAALADRNIWIGDSQLTKYSILPTGNRLPVETIENNYAGATFDHPLALFEGTLIHVHRARGRAGVVVAATATAQGRTLWETDLAIPPAGAPVVDEAAKALTAGNAAGNLFRFDEAAIRSRVQDEPLAAQGIPGKVPALTEAVDLGQGRAVFCGAGADQLLLLNPALGERPAKWVQLDSPLACSVTPLGDGIIAPLTIGQVFYLSAADGSKLAAPFQPTLQPQKEWRYRRAAAVDDNRFVIADGHGKIYLVALANQTQPRFEAVAEADAGPHPIESPFVVLGDSAIAVAGSSHLVRVQLPSLQPEGDSNLPAPVAWGPFPIGDSLLLATANNQLMAISADGQITWQVPLEHGDLAGAPLAQQDSLLIAYRKGVIERRSLADGKPLAAKDIEQPLASGPVAYLQRLVVAASDGTILVMDQP